MSSLSLFTELVACAQFASGSLDSSLNYKRKNTITQNHDGMRNDAQPYTCSNCQNIHNVSDKFHHKTHVLQNVPFQRHGFLSIVFASTSFLPCPFVLSMYNGHRIEWLCAPHCFLSLSFTSNTLSFLSSSPPAVSL